MPWPSQVEKALAALLGSPGRTEPSLRRAVFDRARAGTGDVPENLAALVEKITDRPWSVADADFIRLAGADYSDDQIYELVLAAAAGAGARRLEAGERAIEGAG
jgi:alkylhydroperoxidase family enzyme